MCHALFLVLFLSAVWPQAVRAQAAAAPAASASAAQRVEITGAKAADTEARRQSTAAKIVIGREEIEAFGDTTVGEVLRRLPGVTASGPPGRGGPPRMRGLGAGYTQILLDGQRVPPGFSIESLTPEQIERIEVLRAPTAETGARAIAGTINIITREGFTRKLNDVRLGLSHENGRWLPNLAWTRNGGANAFSFNTSVSVWHNHREHASVGTTTETELPSGGLTRDETMLARTIEMRTGMNATARLQWRLSPTETVLLMPIVFFGEGETRREYRLDQRLPLSPPRFDHAKEDGAGHFGMARLNGQWTLRAGETRLEWKGGVALGESANHSQRTEFDRNGAATLVIDEANRSREPSFSLSLKASRLTQAEHQLVMGAEVEGAQRNDTRSYLENGVAQLTDFGENFQARTRRLALYAQDEWKLSPKWAVHAGARWEGISTQGDALDGSTQHNRSNVFTPLLHAVWRPEERSRDQVRMSLTRSYRSPTLQSLIGRPRVVPAGRNSETLADSMGNPDLKPELASGVDVAVERYLGAGGLFSANVFARRITDLMRTTTTLRTVPWSVAPRWVSQPKNVGSATTMGLELEAKFRLTELLKDAPALDVRSNLSVFRSQVDGVQGPDNRIDQQPPGTLNFGLDYRLRNGWPLTLGGNVNFTPGYRTQLSNEQHAHTGQRRVFDVYALWVFNPSLRLRFTASNLSPLDYLTERGIRTASAAELASNLAPTYRNLGARLELKL